MPRFVLPRAALLAASLALAAPAGAETDADHVTATELRNEIAAALQSVADYTAQERDEALAAAREGLNALDAEIARRQAALRADWAGMSEEAHTETARALARLQTARNRLGERMGALQAGAASAWDELQAGFSGAFDALADAWAEEDSARAPE